MDVRIERRFCGPPDSGNGGYTCGIVAEALGGSDVAVSLKLPPPLGRDLALVSDGETARLMDGESLVAEATRARVAIDVPAPPAFEAAKQAEALYTGQANHIFPTCFVCGPDRTSGDGLRIFPGQSNGQVAAVWTPDPSLFDSEGHLAIPFVWAALDCPGFFAVESAASPAVLGRFAVHVAVRAIAPQPIIVTGWSLSSEGRKHRAGTALHDRSGRLLAVGDALWITLKSPPVRP